MVFNCGRSQGLKLPKLWFSVWFSAKNCGFDLKKNGFHQKPWFSAQNHVFCRFCVTFEFKTKFVFQNFIFGPQTMVFLVLCTQLTPFKTIWPDFIFVHPIDSFQDHLTQFYHYIPNWLLSWPFDLIFVLSTQLTPFKTQFYHCVSNLFLWRPFDLILSLCNLLTHFKTTWPDFYIIYPTDSFQDHLTWFYHSIPY